MTLAGRSEAQREDDVIRYRAALLLVAGALATVPFGVPATTPAATAAPLVDHRDDNRGRDNCDWIRTRDGRERVCFDRQDRREHRRERLRESRRFDHGDRSRWERVRHHDHGDCFRTQWGLACETDMHGVYTVRDRHRGDEFGPDCDVLIVEGWSWRCIDLERR